MGASAPFFVGENYALVFKDSALFVGLRRVCDCRVLCPIGFNVGPKLLYSLRFWFWLLSALSGSDRSR